MTASHGKRRRIGKKGRRTRPQSSNPNFAGTHHTPFPEQPSQHNIESEEGAPMEAPHAEPDEAEVVEADPAQPEPVDQTAEQHPSEAPADEEPDQRPNPDTIGDKREEFVEVRDSADMRASDGRNASDEDGNLSKERI